MKVIPSVFKNKEPKHPWQWPSCKHPKTRSFRSSRDNNDRFPTTLLHVGTHESSTCTSFSNDELSDKTVPSLEVVIRGVRMSERLFFEPEETSSIVKHRQKVAHPFKGSVAMALDSYNPYLDFKKSMEEMVKSQGLLKDWDCLEELLMWYLKMNGKTNHGLIVGAFVDLLVGFADVDSKKTMMLSGSDSTTTTYLSASSSFSSSSASSSLSPH